MNIEHVALLIMLSLLAIPVAWGCWEIYSAYRATQRLARRLRTADERKVPMRTYNITVTWEDIQRGVRNSELGCPTALAMERAGAAGVYFPMHSFPLVVQEWIRDFDAGRPVRPIQFVMEDYRVVPAAKPVVYPAQRPARFEPVQAGRYVAPAANYNTRPARFEPVRTDQRAAPVFQPTYRGRVW